jgi:CHAD domain
MGYRLEPGKPVADEVRRIAAHQLELAIERLTAAGDDTHDGSVHTARRHIKKVRALIRLVRPAHRRRYRAVDRLLRMVNRMLAPMADAQATVAMLARVAWRDGSELPADVVARLRDSVRRRESMAYEDAALTDAFETVAALLRAERDAVGEWRISQTGFDAVASGLEQTAWASRRAMVTLASSRVEDYREWRQRVKAHRLQVRLLKRRCGNGLALDERRLEGLDGYLGDCRNCAILREVLTTDSLLDRTDAALGLRAVRRYERRLRRCARRLGIAIYDETPRHFVTRVERLWHSTRRTQPRGTPWRSAA